MLTKWKTTRHSLFKERAQFEVDPVDFDGLDSVYVNELVDGVEVLEGDLGRRFVGGFRHSLGDLALNPAAVEELLDESVKHLEGYRMARDHVEMLRLSVHFPAHTAHEYL